VEVNDASSGLVEVAVPSPCTSVEVEDSAVLSSEFCVMVDVEAERDLSEDEEVPK